MVGETYLTKSVKSDGSRVGGGEALVELDCVLGLTPGAVILVGCSVGLGFGGNLMVIFEVGGDIVCLTVGVVNMVCKLSFVDLLVNVSVLVAVMNCDVKVTLDGFGKSVAWVIGVKLSEDEEEEIVDICVLVLSEFGDVILVGIFDN